MHWAKTARKQLCSQVIPELWVHIMELAVCYLSATKNMKVAPTVLVELCSLRYFTVHSAFMEHTAMWVEVGEDVADTWP